MPKVSGKKPKKSTHPVTSPTPLANLDKTPDQPSGGQRSVVYDTPSCEIAVFTEEYAKQLLGWQEAPAGVTEGVFSLDGQKVFLFNNVNNRPLYMSNVEVLIQEILRKRWRLNFEGIIIGTTGLVLNGQHTLIALVLAVARWKADPEKYPDWTEEPSITKLIGFGCEETDDVVNTMDTCKGRSLADALYRCKYLEKYSSGQRRALSKILAYAVQKVWERTGVSHHHDLVRTFAESYDFIEKHPHILEAMLHVSEENETKRLLQLFGALGDAAGLLYMMGCSSSSSKDYWTQRTEECLEWDNWEAACKYYVCLAQNNKDVVAVSQRIADIDNDIKQSGGDRISRKESHALLVKGWIAYREKGKITEKDLELEYVVNNGVRSLASIPIVGGIDLGSPDEELEETDETKAFGLSSDEVQERAEKVKKESLDKKAKTKKPVKRKPKPGSFELGQHVWVNDPDGEHWDGSIVEMYDGPDGRIAKVEDASKKVYEAPVDHLQYDEPLD